MSHGRFAAPALMLVALVLLAGCDMRPRGFTNEVDEERLAALVAEPLLADGAERVGGDPNTSANVTIARGEVAVVRGPWGSSGGKADDPWQSSLAMLADIRAEGWSVTRIECSVGPSGDFSGASIIALKDLGGFTAALDAVTESGGSYVYGLVPYHTEPANPWQPSEELALGASCLELPEQPVASSVLGGDSNVERAYLPPEN